MPVYLFLDPKGGVVELVLPMRDAPSIGSTLVRDGVELTRVASDFTVDEQRNRGKFPYVGHAWPRKLPGCTHTKSGKPIIESKRHEREMLARTGFMKE